MWHSVAIRSELGMLALMFGAGCSGKSPSMGSSPAVTEGARDGGVMHPQAAVAVAAGSGNVSARPMGPAASSSHDASAVSAPTDSGPLLTKLERLPDDFAIYRKQPIDYAAQVNEAAAGGITLGLLTGFAGVSSGWPAGTGLEGIGIGDFWTTACPQWRDWAPLADYFARSTLLLETGKPRIDVVIYLDEGIAGVHELTTPKFASATLERAGFSYDFIDPVSLTAARASERPGTLYGASPGYRALILNQQQRLPLKAAQAILAAAKSGLRVVLVGAAPALSTGLADAAANDMLVALNMGELATLKNVAQVADADAVAAALIRLGVVPDAQFGDSCAIMSVHRVSDDGEDIFWLFNPSSEDLSVAGSFAAGGTPYHLDLWNGTHARVAQWNVLEGRVHMPVTVPARSSTAWMFQHQTPPLHVTATDAQGAQYSSTGAILLQDTQGGMKQVSLSDGSTRSLPLPAAPPPLEVQNFQLAVDEISPNGNAKHMLQLAELSDWRKLAELTSAVGSGTYTASIAVPEAWLGADYDVLLTVGEVAGAMQLKLNGQLVTHQTTPGGAWSVKSLLAAGPNALEVRIDTTLINRVSASSGKTGPMDTQPAGLLGPVKLTPVSLAPIPAQGM